MCDLQIDDMEPATVEHDENNYRTAMRFAMMICLFVVSILARCDYAAH